MDQVVLSELPAEDEQEIKAIEARFNDAWNRHDALAMSESLAADAQFVTVNGVWLKGRAAFTELVERLHKGPFKDSKRETTELQVRLLAPGIGVVHSRFRITGDVNEDGTKIPSREGVSTRLVQKRFGQWQTVAVHNTDIRNRRH